MWSFLGIIRDPKAQRVALCLALKLLCHSKMSPSPRDPHPTMCCSFLTKAELSGLMSLPSLGSGQVGWGGVPGSWWLPKWVSGVVQVRKSHTRGRAREGIASSCLVLDSLAPLPANALKSSEILQFSTNTPNLFLENKANAPAVFCEDALLLPQPWQQIHSHCQSEVVGAVGDLP